MKAFKFLRVALLLGGILLSACTAAPAPAGQNKTSAGSDKPLSEVVFTGTIESMNGSQWVINGQTITVPLFIDHAGWLLPGRRNRQGGGTSGSRWARDRQKR